MSGKDTLVNENNKHEKEKNRKVLTHGRLRSLATLGVNNKAIFASQTKIVVGTPIAGTTDDGIGGFDVA